MCVFSKTKLTFFYQLHFYGNKIEVMNSSMQKDNEMSKKKEIMKYKMYYTWYNKLTNKELYI